MKKGTAAAWVIDNAVVMVCFTALSLYFGKWWIILFSALFVSSLKTQATPCRVCDGCGKTFYTKSSDPERELRIAGWIRRRGEYHWEDYCPECQKKEKRGTDHEP